MPIAWLLTRDASIDRENLIGRIIAVTPTADPSLLDALDAEGATPGLVPAGELAQALDLQLIDGAAREDRSILDQVLAQVPGAVLRPVNVTSSGVEPIGQGGVIDLSDSRRDQSIDSGGGDQLILTGSGDDEVRAGRGHDWVATSSGSDSLFGESGNDRLDCGGGDDSARGGSGHDAIRGGGGDDRIDGGGGHDFVWGNAGDDLLIGGSGDDILIGGKGRDELRGGRDDDLLIGHGSADTFVFGRGDGDDTIPDFAVRIDTIEIASGASRFRDLDISREGGDTLIEFANVSILLEDIRPGQLDADDFIF
jgi:Ca2+-binding RTX toxin-like protein